MIRFPAAAFLALLVAPASGFAAQAVRIEAKPLATKEITWKRGYHPKAFRVVDGDTIAVRKASGEVSIRGYGFDTPELAIRCEHARAVAAKDELTRILASGRVIVRESANVRDKYGRAIGDILVNGRRVSDLMVGRGFAHAYVGGPRSPWPGC